MVSKYTFVLTKYNQANTKNAIATIKIVIFIFLEIFPIINAHTHIVCFIRR
ncbi:MAG: hypothetical protein EAX89_06820 [Candidatus Lokiarchaeota archaeon]|nr:hypothetical protein [Candidatus Lokiarchaeota archaeon]